jgi:hypothetical protein
MAIVNAQLTTTQLDIVTVPAGERYAITNIMVCNQDATDDASFDLHFIPSGDPLDNAVTRVINGLTLPAGETFTFDSEKIVLGAGDKVAFVASPDSGSGNTDLSATVSYLEV